MKNCKYLLVGNSAAAIGCVEGIRSHDTDGSVIIVSDEAHHTYSRPLISYLIEGRTDIQRMKYRPDDFYEKSGCTALLGRKAVSLDPAAHVVSLEDGEKIKYEKVLIATGSAPFVPPFPGLDTVGKKFSFMKLDDALALDDALGEFSGNARVLIIGAGLIGLKCAEGIHKKCSSVTVVDLADRILSSILEEESGAIVRKKLEDAGISFRLGCSVAEFNQNEARLDSGEILEFDILVLAVGVRPNVSLVKDAGGEVGRGIVTDENQRTSLPDVYAAGDCTECYDVSLGGRRTLAILPLAYMEGECAGKHMTGLYAKFDCAAPMNAIHFFGYHIITAGTYEGEATALRDGDNYKKFFIRDGVLAGYILLGDVLNAGIYTNLVRNRVPLDEVDFDMLCRRPALAAMSRSYRDEKLGGAKK